MHRDGNSYAKIAKRCKVNVLTVNRWAKTPTWQTEINRLNQLEQEAAATMALNYKEEYTAQLMRSRDLIRQTADQQVQIAGQLSIAVAKATKALTTEEDPLAAIAALSRGGTCHVAATAAQVSRAAKDLLNETYAIARVLEFIERQDK